jgi:hypothetical protein
MKSYFYPQSTYTAVTAFAEVFCDMTVRVYDKNGAIVGIKPVPATLTPREKIVSILKASNINDVDPQVDNYLPRISINLSGMEWNPDRMRGKYETRLLNIEYEEDGLSREMQVDMQPVPYNLEFEVVVWAKYMTDGMQIMENILPWFAPEIQISFKERNFGIEHKCKTTLNSVTPNFVYEYGEGGDKSRRVLQWTLAFTMETIMWKPMEIKPEILCSIIRIANVPCQKLPFAGTKIVTYDPIIPNQVTSIFDKPTNLTVFDLDAQESYDLMTDYWKLANRNMQQPTVNDCVDANCATDPGPRPIWDPALDATPCHPPLKYPLIIIDPLSGNITNYWQEEVVTNSIIEIVSYIRVYSSNGTLITDTTVIPNDTYPSGDGIISATPDITGY